MKTLNILVSTLAFLPLTGCLSENTSDTKPCGELSVEVVTKKPYETRSAAYDVKDFPVSIFMADGTTLVQSYASAAEVPSSIRISAGTYVLEAHTPGQLLRLMTSPYYKGRENAVVIEGASSPVTITCKQANGSIKVNYDAEFLKVFTSWSISFDDGGSQALSFTKDDGENPAASYILFEENVKKIIANFRGTTVDGNTVSASQFLTKSEATETYSGDTDDFGGGDAIVVNLTPVESTSGNITIGLTASIVFDETREDVIINVVDNGGGFTPDEPDGPGSDSITLDLPDDISYPFMTEPSDASIGDTYIRAEKGIKSITVRIESTSEDMVSSLGDLADQYGVDFIAGAEVVANQDCVDLFASLGQTLAVPAVGDTEYTFPIGNFFGFLKILQGTHTFYLSVTDMEGNTKSGKLLITIE